MSKKKMLLLTICLTVILSSCASNEEKFRDFPVQFGYRVDFENKSCKKYELIDTKDIKWKMVAVLPLKECENVFGFKPAETSLLMFWVKDVIVELDRLYEKMKKKCIK